MNQSEHDNQMTQIELKSPKISQLISALQAMKMEHGDIRVGVPENDLGCGFEKNLLLDMAEGILVIVRGAE